jgi:hypothetical protein
MVAEWFFWPLIGEKCVSKIFARVRCGGPITDAPGIRRAPLVLRAGPRSVGRTSRVHCGRCRRFGGYQASSRVQFASADARAHFTAPPFTASCQKSTARIRMVSADIVHFPRHQKTECGCFYAFSSGCGDAALWGRCERAEPQAVAVARVLHWHAPSPRHPAVTSPTNRLTPRRSGWRRSVSWRRRGAPARLPGAGAFDGTCAGVGLCFVRKLVVAVLPLELAPPPDSAEADEATQRAEKHAHDLRSPQ